MKKETVTVLLIEDNAEHVEFMEQLLAASHGAVVFHVTL
jgi:hypothetical protein